MDPLLGQIVMFAGNFAPRGWALCDGTLLQISQNQALFSILGTTYGGNGVQTFALPDLRGRGPVHAGQGAGLTLVELGDQSGSEATQQAAPAVDGPGIAVRAAPPSLAVNFIIATEGIYPSRW